MDSSTGKNESPSGSRTSVVLLAVALLAEIGLYGYILATAGGEANRSGIWSLASVSLLIWVPTILVTSWRVSLGFALAIAATVLSASLLLWPLIGLFIDPSAGSLVVGLAMTCRVVAICVLGSVVVRDG